MGNALSASSGDVIADRRFAYAEGLTSDGDHVAAADLLDQIVERTPGWAAAWLALGLARERCGHSAALEALQRASALDLSGTLGADLHAARFTEGATGMPQAFVRALFDQYAPRFDDHLIGTLAYTGPAALIDAVDRVAPARRFAAALDLGCGTGLMAAALAGRTDALDGVELAPAMAARARASGRYRTLVNDDLAAFLACAAPNSYDLVTAADVIPYLGDLASVLADVARVLRPSGLLAFTAQSRAGKGYGLGADMRFAHSTAYLRATLGAGALAARIDDRPVRRDRGIAVPGVVVVAARP